LDQLGSIRNCVTLTQQTTVR